MGEVRATELERERAIHSLRESYARGDLDDEQFEEKLNAMFTAHSSAALRELLPATPGDVGHVLATTVALSSTDVDTVERHLSRDERVEWIGKPDATKRFSAADGKLILPGLGMFAFGIFWTAGAASADGAFGLLGIPLLATASFLALGPFIRKASRRRRTTYAVTNRRVIAIVRNWKGGGESMEAMYLRSIPNISTSAGRDGKGSVEFGTTSSGRQRANIGMDYYFARREEEKGGLSFSDIEDPTGVADLIERLRDAAPAPNVVAAPVEPRATPQRDESRLPFPPSSTPQDEPRLRAGS